MRAPDEPRASFRGVFAIPCTPFAEDGGVDWDSLRREVEFCLAAGAHGIVAPVNASEFTSLSDEERRRVVETAAQVVDRRMLRYSFLYLRWGTGPGNAGGETIPMPQYSTRPGTIQRLRVAVAPAESGGRLCCATVQPAQTGCVAAGGPTGCFDIIKRARRGG